MARPLALITNDDGIDCWFLTALVAAMQEHFQLLVAAPAREQSWVSRAFSRHRDVKVTPSDRFDCPAWAVDGTPSDTVNIALAHLVPQRPDLVVSGINVGFNASQPLVFASGTVAAAHEAACWELPAIATSMVVPGDEFLLARNGPDDLSDKLNASLHAAARLTTRFAQKLPLAANQRGLVHNLNFPFPTRDETPIRETVPGPLRLNGLFAEAEKGIYRFRYSEGVEGSSQELTDRMALAQGEASLSRLAFHQVGQPAGTSISPSGHKE